MRSVRIEREGSIYSGPELQLKVQRFEGFFLQPEFEFLQLGSGGPRVAAVEAGGGLAILVEEVDVHGDAPTEDTDAPLPGVRRLSGVRGRTRPCTSG